MRQIGHKTPGQAKRLPVSTNFALATIHQRTGQALAAVATTGILKGIYRFASHEEMNKHSDESLASAIAANVRQRGNSPK